MTKVIQGPRKYIQGNGVLADLASYSTKLGDRALILISKSVRRTQGQAIEESYGKLNAFFQMDTFQGECCMPEVERLKAICASRNISVVIGIGGGKTMDTAKAVAHFCKLPVIIAPSIASSDAPCSALSVLYTPTGEFQEYLILPANPDYVLVDTGLISKAPARLLVAGMGDALATYFEARVSAAAGKLAMAGGRPTKSALALAELCYKTLLADGLKARLAVENGSCTEAVENIIEANTYLSGIGFESGGLGAAHAVHNGLTLLEETHHYYHGEKVSFGTLVQLVLENSPREEIDTVLTFCREVGLPTCLKDLGAENVSKERLLEVAKAACAPGETIHNMQCQIDPETVLGAILVADKLGSCCSVCCC